MAFTKADQRAAYRRWYERNRKKHMARVAQQKADLYEWYETYKSTLTCRRCGMSFKDYPSLCDFHHFNDLMKYRTKSGKTRTIADLVRAGGKQRLLDEISVAVPLCANCHRIIHVCVQ